MYRSRKTARPSISLISVPLTPEPKCVSPANRSSLACDTLNSLLLPTVHAKYGQKRPETSPIPSPMHHHGQSSHGGQTTVMPAHMNSQSIQQHHHSQHKSQNNLQASANSRSNEQSFAAALRSLAKQKIDVKDEEMTQQGGESKNSNSNPRGSEKDQEAMRQSSGSRGMQYDNRPTDMRNLTSPQPPEKKVCSTLHFRFQSDSNCSFHLKIPRLSSNANQPSANMQSELLARSGFQPYRPDERHIHPAGAQFPMDAFGPFGPMPGLQPGELSAVLWASEVSYDCSRSRRSLQSSGLIISRRFILRSENSKHVALESSRTLLSARFTLWTIALWDDARSSSAQSLLYPRKNEARRGASCANRPRGGKSSNCSRRGKGS